MRHLVHVPILHAAVELGALGAQLRARADPAGAGDARARVIDALWDGIRERLLGLDAAWTEVLLYQDGLAASGHELEIVRELAGKGSPNHRLLLELLARGARLVGTEAPELLLRELDLARGLIAACDRPEAERQAAFEALRHEAATSLAARDAFMSRRIADTLGEGQTGLLFLGALHRVHERLPPSIAVRTLACAVWPPADVRARHARATHDRARAEP